MGHRSALIVGWRKLSLERAVTAILCLVRHFQGLPPGGSASEGTSYNRRAFIYRAGTEAPPNFPEIFRVSLRRSFSAVDTQTAVLVSTATVGGSQHRIPRSLYFLVFRVNTAVLFF